IILDAGTGLYKADRYIRTKKPIYLFLSHFHLDHVIGLHALAKFNFPQGIKVYGPPGMKKFFDTVINKPYTMPLRQLSTKIKLYELSKRSLLPVSVEFKKLSHPVTCYGYRFNLEGKIISYCTDTGLCRNLISLARESDLLITECALKSGQRNKKWAHLNPEDAALAAKKAGAKKMALMHFDAGLYLTLAERRKAGVQAGKAFKNTQVATDGITIKI
ncbi:MAG: ribonuclease Z, partial [Candidatus Omnitrophota bacterium]